MYGDKHDNHQQEIIISLISVFMKLASRLRKEMSKDRKNKKTKINSFATINSTNISKIRIISRSSPGSKRNEPLSKTHLKQKTLPQENTKMFQAAKKRKSILAMIPLSPFSVLRLSFPSWARDLKSILFLGQKPPRPLVRVEGRPLVVGGEAEVALAGRHSHSAVLGEHRCGLLL